MKIRVISCCLNEEEMLPFYLDYYSSFADKIVIFDGGSTDKSIEIIKSYNKTEIIQNDHPLMDERNLTGIRNEAYKVDRESWDWQIVVDIDEFIYDKNLLDKLEYFKSKNITLPDVIGYDMYSLEFPIFRKGEYIIDTIRTGKRNDEWQSKKVIFNPHQVNINYGLGCHACCPTGNVVKSNEPLFLLHYNYIGYDHFIKRHKFNSQRMSQFNLKNNLAYHIPMFSTMTRNEFEEKVKNEAKDLISY